MENKDKYKNLPFINLSKENMMLLKDMFETDEIGKIMIAITDRVFFGVEPTTLSKSELGGYKQLMSVIERKADSYLNKVAQGTENFKKINESKKKEKESELSCYSE